MKVGITDHDAVVPGSFIPNLWALWLNVGLVVERLENRRKVLWKDLWKEFQREILIFPDYTRLEWRAAAGRSSEYHVVSCVDGLKGFSMRWSPIVEDHTSP